MREKIKIVIADDQELIRDSLKIVLSANQDMEVIDTVADGREVIRSVRSAKPDVILMDVRMPGMDGVSCTQIIKENYPQIKIIILTTFDDDEYVYNALKYGASVYLLKGVSMAELARIRRAVSVPIVVIGGLCAENAGAFRPLGVSGAAAASAILTQPDVRGAAARLKAAFLGR